MTDHTEEEIAAIVAAEVEKARNAARIASYGDMFFTMSIEYVADQVKRGVVPQQVLQVGQMCYNDFLANTTPQPAPTVPKEQPPQ